MVCRPTTRPSPTRLQSLVMTLLIVSQSIAIAVPCPWFKQSVSLLSFIRWTLTNSVSKGAVGPTGTGVDAATRSSAAQTTMCRMHTLVPRCCCCSCDPASAPLHLVVPLHRAGLSSRPRCGGTILTSSFGLQHTLICLQPTHLPDPISIQILAWMCVMMRGMCWYCGSVQLPDPDRQLTIDAPWRRQAWANLPTLLIFLSTEAVVVAKLAYRWIDVQEAVGVPACRTYPYDCTPSTGEFVINIVTTVCLLVYAVYYIYLVVQARADHAKVPFTRYRVTYLYVQMHVSARWGKKGGGDRGWGRRDYGGVNGVGEVCGPKGGAGLVLSSMKQALLG